MKKYFLFFVFIAMNISAQENLQMTGVLGFDTKAASINVSDSGSSDSLNISIVKAKSPFLAALMSAVVPGAGEIYSGNFLKAAIFLAVEAAAITTSVIYNNKGDDQTSVFEKFAQENWDVARYARWTIANLSILKYELNADDYSDLFYDDAQTQVNWSVLNRLEEDISGYYSHRLAPFGDQQYYEMIGKYPQFNPGWAEFGDDPTTPYYFGDPLVDQFHEYSKMRGEANDFYNVASKAVIIVMVNHLASAIDAAFSAASYNKSLKMNLSLEKTNVGYFIEYNPQLNLQYRF